jgi:hypothetical protein
LPFPVSIISSFPLSHTFMLCFPFVFLSPLCFWPPRSGRLWIACSICGPARARSGRRGAREHTLLRFGFLALGLGRDPTQDGYVMLCYALRSEGGVISSMLCAAQHRPPETWMYPWKGGTEVWDEMGHRRGCSHPLGCSGIRCKVCTREGLACWRK